MTANSKTKKEPQDEPVSSQFPNQHVSSSLLDKNMLACEDCGLHKWIDSMFHDPEPLQQNSGAPST